MTDTPTPPASGQDAASEVEAAMAEAASVAEIIRDFPVAAQGLTFVERALSTIANEVTRLETTLRASAEQVRVLTGERDAWQIKAEEQEREAAKWSNNYLDMLHERNALRARAEKAEAALGAAKTDLINTRDLKTHGMSDQSFIAALRANIDGALQRVSAALTTKTEAAHAKL